MNIDSKDLIVGTSGDITPLSLRLIEMISSGKEFSLNDQALNFPNELSIAIFNYPIIKNGKFKEFAEATKRISSAKYAYYKKSGQFKENITKLIIGVFKKHHESDNLDQFEQIQRVRMAERMVKFIGELYNAEFYSNENLAYFCESLRKNSEVSKISEECLTTLIQIVLDRVRNEAKQSKYNVHTAAILNIINDSGSSSNTQLKKNYKDLEIIEAVKKNKSYQLSSKNDSVRQFKKIFELVLSGNISLADCVQKAYDSSIIFPDSFENEMFQLCVDYLKKSFEASDAELMSQSKCPSIIVFIGRLFNMDALSNDTIRSFLSFLSNRDQTALCKLLFNKLIDVIYEKVLDEGDEVLKSFIPDGYKRTSNEDFEEFEDDKDEARESAGAAVNGQEDQRRPSTSSSSAISSALASPQQTPKHASKSAVPHDSSHRPLTVTALNENVSDPFEKFKELLNKLSPSNVPYILRETAQIKFGSGEEVVKKSALAVIEHAINKQTLIKPIVEIAVKLHETIVPNFSPSLMKKHLRAVISMKIFKCSERESTGYCQLVNELHRSNYYDQFNVIILLESFIENFNTDRTALPSLLKFTIELEEVIVSKKKNIRQKLMNIAESLAAKMTDDNHADNKEGIEHALKILRGETIAQKESKIKREDSNEDYQEVSDYRFEGTGDEYIISVENIPQSPAKITLVPSTKNHSNQQQQPQIQKPNTPEIFANSLTMPSNGFIPTPLFNPAPIPFVLPPMHVPPPMMLIAPPVLLQAPIGTHPNMQPFITQPQRQAPLLTTINRPLSQSFPSLLETVENPGDLLVTTDDNNNQLRPQSSGFKRVAAEMSDGQSGSSANVSEKQYNGNDNGSDDMYDTVSNAESSSGAAIDTEDADNECSESAYSSLGADHDMNLNYEEKLKSVIRENFPADIKDIEKFAEVFLTRGMKSKSRGFIKLIDVVEEGLENNAQLLDSFLRIFETKIFEFVKMLSQNEYLSSSERDKSLRLILLAAETFNAGLMKSDTLFACMEILFNNIGNGKSHQITMFHQLIKITLDKVVAYGLQNVCKSYLDRLAKRVETFSNSEERNLLSWEIFVTMKVLLYRTQQARMSCPVTYFKSFLKDLDGNNFSAKVNELRENMAIDKKQLTEIVEIYIGAALANCQTAILVELGVELSNLAATDVEDFTFKKYFESKAHHDIKICLEDPSDIQKMTELMHWTHLIGNLYLGDAASIYLILCALEMLLDKEVLNMKIVDCINILLRKVGFKIDVESVLILDKFFLFFNHITNSENSYRSKVYKELIKLRTNNWVLMESDRDIEAIEDLLRKMSNENMMQIALAISGLIYKSAEVYKAFINMLWKNLLMNRELVLMYAKLTQAISCNYQRFETSLMAFLNRRNQTFKALAKSEDKFTPDVKTKLSTVVRFVVYCYALNCASEDDLLQWIAPKFIEHFTVEDKTEIQVIVGPKVNESSNNELKGFLGLIEYKTRESFFASLASVKTLLMDM